MRSQTAAAMNEWLKALKAAQLKRPSADGITTEEIAEAMNVSHSVASVRLRHLVRSGMARFVGKRQGDRIDGTTYFCPVYSLVKAKG